MIARFFTKREDVRLVAEQRAFDLAHYERECGRSFRDQSRGISHYLRRGWREGLSPSRAFDTNFYLSRNADVREGGAEPLLHFLRNGKAEGRSPRLGVGLTKTRSAPPSEDEWASLEKRERDRPRQRPLVDVVMPLGEARLDAALSCISTVLATENVTPFRLTVVVGPNTARAHRRQLDRLAERLSFSLLDASQIAEIVSDPSGTTDLLALDPHARVGPGWIDRLRGHAQRACDIASVSALSNNAGMLSYPYPFERNNIDLGLPSVALDAICAAANSEDSVQISAPVGPSTYVPRGRLPELARLAPSQLSQQSGCHIAALDVFVESSSVSVPHALACVLGSEVLRESSSTRYRDESQADTTVSTDPIARARERIDVARARRGQDRPAILFVEHGWGGGIERHMEDLARTLVQEGYVVIRLTPSPARKETLKLAIMPAGDFPNLPEVNLRDLEGAVNHLRAFRVAKVHIHSLVGFELQSFGLLAQLCQKLGRPYDVTLHDYAAVCPRITMIDWTGRFCDTRSPEHCHTCLEREASPFGRVDIAHWRKAYSTLLDGARRILVPDADVATRIESFLPHLPNPLIRPHLEHRNFQTRPCTQPGAPTARRRRVALIGTLAAHKGSRVVLALATDAVSRGLPLDFVLFGSTDLPELSHLPSVTITGAYQEDEIDDLLRAHPCHLAFFASVWPETFLFTLSVAFRNGLYPVAFDLGAQARRIREADFGETVPLSLVDSPSKLNDVLLAIVPRRAPSVTKPVEAERLWTGAAAYYDDPNLLPAVP